jgi:hypothetical protein
MLRVHGQSRFRLEAQEGSQAGFGHVPARDGRDTVNGLDALPILAVLSD